MSENKKISVDQLRNYCNPEQFSFQTTQELEDFAGILGQNRALEALEFGVGMQQPGYNMFVLGPPGVGKHTLLREQLHYHAREMATADDWCYVFNFDDPQSPNAIRLPAGRGRTLRDDMLQLVDDLRTAIPSAFQTEQYHVRQQEIQEELHEKTRRAFDELAEKAAEHNVVIIRSGENFTFAPVRDDKPLGQEEFEALPEDEQDRISEIMLVLEENLRSILHQRAQWQREAREKLKQLNREVGMFAIAHLVEELKQRYQDVDEVEAYLDALQEDVINNLYEFRLEEQVMGPESDEQPSFRRYQVNLMVDNSQLNGAPVLYADDPLFQNLVGKVEYLSQMGTLVTDYLLIKPGMLHRANGGYLLLDAQKLLTRPYAWEALKRVLSSSEISIHSLAELLGLVSTVSLEPEPIPVDIKVVLVGDRMLYYLLEAYDPDFAELFKVAVDFESSMPCSPETWLLYARVIATLVRKDKLLHFDRQAVSRVIEYAMRMVEDQKRLSTHMGSIADLLREADYWSRRNQHQLVSRSDVQQAIDKHNYRHDRARERIHDEIVRGTIMVDVSGVRTAVVNGLFVVEMGNYSFGQPARITASVRVGDGDVIDIEREAELGGSLHSKGVMILSAFLGSRYATSRPLSVSASLVFEQSYGMVEGDSASMGELCCLLSAIAEKPMKQSLAITGSVNQLGEAQAIGGVNEKIEGFFDICKSRGLTGEQGVIIPASNVEHLLLNDEVVEAVANQQFAIYPVSHINQALALLSDMPAGERDEDGNFPEQSFNYHVEQHLLAMAEIKHESGKDEARHEDEQEHEHEEDKKQD